VTMTVDCAKAVVEMKMAADAAMRVFSIMLSSGA
jgi:hypothetical protein